jgi:hypothetical protein
VLRANQIDTGEIEEFGSTAVGCQLPFGELESNPLWIAIFGLRIIHGKCEQPFHAELGRNRIT